MNVGRSEELSKLNLSKLICPHSFFSKKENYSTSTMVLPGLLSVSQSVSQSGAEIPSGRAYAEPWRQEVGVNWLAVAE